MMIGHLVLLFSLKKKKVQETCTSKLSHHFLLGTSIFYLFFVLKIWLFHAISGSVRFGNAVTVVEMDGEIDMDNMEEQLKEIRWFKAAGCHFLGES